MNKVSNDRMVEMVRAMAKAGYNKSATADMLRMSKSTMTRLCWQHPEVVFGTKKLPKSWIADRDWVSREPDNLQHLAGRINQWVEFAPQVPVETILARYPMLDRGTAGRWLLAGIRAITAQRGIARRAAQAYRDYERASTGSPTEGA
jgi:hypothetical protein